MTVTSPTTIRRKLITAMMLTSTIVLVLLCTTLVIYDVVSYRSASVRGLTTRAQVFATNASAALAFQNPEDGRQVLGALSADPSMVLGALYDRSGRLFASYPPGAQPQPTLQALPVPSHRFENGGLVILQPVTEGNRWLGTFYLRSDLRTIHQRFRMYLLVVLFCLLGSLGVAFALSSWLQRGISRPVRALAAAAGRVAERQDYSVRVSATSDDELGFLTEAFNDMLGKIQERDAALGASEARLERRVKLRTAELETLNGELEAFSYSVSHDLRAPLRHVNAFADLLQRHAGETLDDKSRRYLGHISDAACKMGELIDDLLSFSRMNRVEMSSVRVDLDALVKETREELTAETSGRDIEWRVASLPELQGDAAMLRQVFVNLMSNAVKYTSTRAHARVEIDAVETDDEIILRFRDNGVGFDMAYAAKLFGVFQRLHSAEEFEGTGIGLANVRRIIQRHGGRTWAEGELDQGATFFCALPRHARTEAPDQREAA